MMKDYEKRKSTKEMLLRIAKGTDPLTGELIPQDSFLHDPEIIRSFYYMVEVLDRRPEGAYNRMQSAMLPFQLSLEQKSKVVFPDVSIGVNEFSRCINACIDAEKSKKLTGVELNRKLKSMGILGEISTDDQKKRTVTNENSQQYGFETEKRIFNGTEYDKIVINAAGKQYLLDHIETIMNGAAQ